MKTIILKWNPAFSSYTMLRFLKDLHHASERDEEERKSNWSVWDYDKVSKGARFYLLKVGFGQTGIVARGTVTSDAYRGEDWSFYNRPRYYVDYVPTFMVNPDGCEILTSRELSEKIPDVEWFGGHSGIVLSDENATALEDMWENYVNKQSELFEKASDDNLFMDGEESENDVDYEVKFIRDYDDDLELDVITSSRYFEKKTLRKQIEIFDVARLMLKLKVGSKRMLVKTLHQLYPSANELASLCAALFEYGINYRLRINIIAPNEESDEDECEEDE